MVNNDRVLESLKNEGVDTKNKTGNDTAELTGICQRWLSPLTSTQHAVNAAKNAIVSAKTNSGGNFDESKLQLICSGGSSPDFIYPSCACEVQGQILPNHKIEAFSIPEACTSFVEAVAVAKSRMKDKGYQYALVTVGEQIGVRSNAKKSLNNCLWGTGGGALILEFDPKGDSNTGILADRIISDGAKASWTRSHRGGFHPIHDTYEEADASMEGHEKDIHRYGLRDVPEAAQEFLCANEEHLDPGNPVWLLSHNANWKMQLGIGKQLGIPEHKVLSRISDRGNTSSASIAITLAWYADKGTFQPNDLLLLVGFGGGMSMAFVLYRW